MLGLLGNFRIKLHCAFWFPDSQSRTMTTAPSEGSDQGQSPNDTKGLMGFPKNSLEDITLGLSKAMSEVPRLGSGQEVVGMYEEPCLKNSC